MADFHKFHTSPLAAHKSGTRHGADGAGPIALNATHQNRPDYRAAAVEDMANKAVRFTTREFCDKFFPLSDSVTKRPKWGANLFDGLKEASGMSEAKVSAEFVSRQRRLRLLSMLTVLQIKAIDTVDGLTPDLKLSESPHCPDEGDKDTSKSKVDAGFFRLTCVPTDGRPHWADQIVPVEFKSHKTENDPYDDRSEDSPDADAIKRKEVRGQLIDYAEEVFRYQHRTEVYMLLIMGQRFRFLRWDRSGTVVTPATNYYENPDVLCEMLWRMSLLDDTQLGLDPTAIRIRPDMPEFDKMNEAAIPHPSDIDHAERTFPADFVISDDFVFRYVRKGFAESLGAEWPRYRLEVPDGDSVRSFLVGKPTFRASGMAGRGTRGYIALDCKTQQFVWLKDAWRAYYDLVDKEGDVLIHLNETGVPHVPTVVCHGDILDQATKSPEYWDDKNGSTVTNSRVITRPPSVFAHLPSSSTLAMTAVAPSNGLKRSRPELEGSEHIMSTRLPREDQCPLRRHKHYRLVAKEVCMPLVKFQSGLQLLEIIYTCVRGMSYVLLIVRRTCSTDI